MPETKPKYKNKITSIDSNSNTAITLIALIITIIVLLILAGVTLNMIMGENGIINKAQLAKEKNNEAQEKENENLKSLENSLDEIYRGNVTEMKMNCLWENPNSEVSFTEQTVELTEDITKYNFYEILYFDQTSEATNNEGCKSTGLIPTNEKVKITGTRNVLSCRKITEIKNNKVTFSNAEYYTGYNGTTKNDNVMCIPYKILVF